MTSMPARNPLKDQVAIVGIGLSPYTRKPGPRSIGSQAIVAAIEAIRDAGLRAEDIDGVCGSAMSDVEMQSALGLPEVTWGANHRIPFNFLLVEAVNAVFSGACNTALVYHSTYRPPSARDVGVDPVRLRSAGIAGFGMVPWKSRSRTVPDEPGTLAGGIGYASWAGRYLHEYGVSREVFGHLAISNRSYAVDNENAVMREPMTMADYMAAPIIRSPLGLLDMDLFVDGADALVITTAERARDLDVKPVLVHAMTLGRPSRCREDQVASLSQTGQEIVARSLWAKSDVKLDDVSVFMPYDGFTFINAMWIESVGYCARGEATDFVRHHWDGAKSRLVINNRVAVNPHGGNLSEGATQGAGAMREAVTQLRGKAGARQVLGADVALVTPGGIVWNAGGVVLRTET